MRHSRSPSYKGGLQSRSPSPNPRMPSRGRSHSRSLSRSPRPRSLSRSPRRKSYSRSRSRSPRSRMEAANPGNTLYVTGLSGRVTERALDDHFSKEGKVAECRLIVEPRSRISRGFAFITMDTLKDADRCIKYLNHTVLEGRHITVEKSKRKRPRTPTPGNYLGLKNARDSYRGGGYGREDYGGSRRSPYRDYSPRRSPYYDGRSRRGRSRSPPYSSSYRSPDRGSSYGRRSDVYAR